MKSPRWLEPWIGHTNIQDSQIMSSTLSFNYLSWLVLKDLDKLFFESARTRGESCEPQEQKGWFPFCQGAPWHRLWRTGQEKNTWRRAWISQYILSESIRYTGSGVSTYHTSQEKESQERIRRDHSIHVCRALVSPAHRHIAPSQLATPRRSSFTGESILTSSGQ